MSERDADVVIAGGGLAGCATALALVRRGARVVCVDKAEFPRDKPCGEGLLPHGVEQLAALGVGDVLDACGAQPFRGILYRFHDVTAPGDFEGGALGRGVRRRALDQALREKAASAGVRFETATVVRAHVTDDQAALELASGARLTGRFLVGADGPRSIVRHTLGLDGGAPRKPRYALRRHFEARAGMPERVEVNAVDGYELYVTPVAPGVIGVAALCEKRTMDAGAGAPDARLDALIARCPEVAARVGAPVSKALACGPLRVRARDVFAGRAVLVGDAAGYVDAITGEGMSLALKTAGLAASAIAGVLEGRAESRATFAHYRSERARAFRDHAILTFGLVELARRPLLARRAIARLAREPALFSRLLAVNNGTRTFFDLSPLDWLKLVIGSAPRALPASRPV